MPPPEPTLSDLFTDSQGHISDVVRTIIFMLFLGAVIVGVLCSAVAESKDRSIVTWFLAGFLFNIFALIAIAGMPVMEPDEAPRPRWYPPGPHPPCTCPPHPSAPAGYAPSQPQSLEHQPG